jgi:hypothetical protein
VKCCGQDLNSIELQVSDQPYVLYRCGICSSNHWLRNGERVPFAEVTAAMERHTESKAAAKMARYGPGRG